MLRPAVAQRAQHAQQRTVFVTVGTTRFDALSSAADSQELAAALLEAGFTRLVMQVRRPAPEQRVLLEQRRLCGTAGWCACRLGCRTSRLRVAGRVADPVGGRRRAAVGGRQARGLRRLAPCLPRPAPPPPPTTLTHTHTHRRLQVGSGGYRPHRLLPPNSRCGVLRSGLSVEWFDYAPSLTDLIGGAALVISHAGEGQPSPPDPAPPVPVCQWGASLGGGRQPARRASQGRRQAPLRPAPAQPRRPPWLQAPGPFSRRWRQACL
jgi:UDP-N-acetylglucosamine transferase subunit ALG13